MRNEWQNLRVSIKYKRPLTKNSTKGFKNVRFKFCNNICRCVSSSQKAYAKVDYWRELLVHLKVTTKINDMLAFQVADCNNDYLSVWSVKGCKYRMLKEENWKEFEAKWMTGGLGPLAKWRITRGGAAPTICLTENPDPDPPTSQPDPLILLHR